MFKIYIYDYLFSSHSRAVEYNYLTVVTEILLGGKGLNISEVHYFQFGQRDSLGSHLS